MDNIVIDYYTNRFGDNLSSAFIHLVREIGEIALSLEKNNESLAKLKITESTALLQYIAYKHGFNLEEEIQTLYSKKLNSIKEK
ncbi:MAG TPA: hypothetical protein VFG45_03385 [Candidatus Nitrosocosmicus sp.]|nr:hypothetical protein [Candidatus Nitrosocosmicus sp.]